MKKIIAQVLITVLLLALTPGCSKTTDNLSSSTQANDTSKDSSNILSNSHNKLNSFFPQEVGYKWIYNGFAEYGHIMELDNIVREDDRLEYYIRGEVQDASGFPPTEKHKFEIKYSVGKGVVREHIVKPGRLPHKITEFDIIREPLIKGNSWKGNVYLDEKKVELKSIIIDIGKDVNNKNFVKIKYEAPYKGMPNDTYTETRVFREGKGIQYFENTFNKDVLFNYQLFER